eukprot:2354265-Amphidinium_carterae.3
MLSRRQLEMQGIPSDQRMMDWLSQRWHSIVDPMCVSVSIVFPLARAPWILSLFSMLAFNRLYRCHLEVTPTGYLRATNWWLELQRGAAIRVLYGGVQV